MKILEYNQPVYRMEHEGFVFDVVTYKCGEGRRIFNITSLRGGWNDLAAETNTHPEVLLELIEEEIEGVQDAKDRSGNLPK